jgi:chloramphenicol-sensitive protein RarD
MQEPANQLPASQGASRGLWALVTAFTIWGLLPLYLRELAAVPAGQIMAHRLVLCCAVVLALLAVRGELAAVRSALALPSTRWRLCASALLISANWLLYVWAIQNGRVIESSLGYFINPLVNVLLGVLVLRERLSRVQWGAVALAAAGVVHLTWLAGAPPWIALVLALSFGSYGLVRKTIAVDALAGLGSETLLLTPFGVAYLIGCELEGSGVLFELPAHTLGWLLCSGALTAVPLALFAYGARHVRYSTVGLVQYIGPSLQLTLGIVLFQEPFSAARAFGFALIWAGLALYAGSGVWQGRRIAAAAARGADAG